MFNDGDNSLSETDLEGLEPPLLDETWGLGVRTIDSASEWTWLHLADWLRIYKCFCRHLSKRDSWGSSEARGRGRQSGQKHPVGWRWGGGGHGGEVQGGSVAVSVPGDDIQETSDYTCSRWSRVDCTTSNTRRVWLGELVTARRRLGRW